MTNLSLVSRDEVSENQIIRSRVAKTQQPDAERLTCKFCAVGCAEIGTNGLNFSFSVEPFFIYMVKIANTIKLKLINYINHII